MAIEKINESREQMNPDIEKITKTLEQSNYEIDTETRLSWAGLKDNQEIAPIMEKYKWLYTLETVQATKEQYEAEQNPERKEELRLLFFNLANSYLYQKIAKKDDEIKTFLMQSSVEVDGEKIPYYNVGPKILKTDDFQEREKLQDASFAIVKQINPDYLSNLQSEIKILEEKLGFQNYINFYQAQKRMDYAKFQQTVLDTREKLQDLYRQKMAQWIEKILQRPWKNLKSCHASYLRQVKDFNASFPKEKLIPSYIESMKDMGLDVENQPNIHIDFENRPNKNPRASCHSVKVPEEIHLLIKPIGDYYDYECLFHEAGHAQHWGHVDSRLPYSFRHLAPSYALTELYSYLFESLPRNPLWLQKHLGISRDMARQITFKTELANLFMLILYLGKFSYEHRLFSQENLKGGDKIYSKILGDFTGFIYDPVMYLANTDTGFYSADYLRAWIGRAQLVGFMEKEFGENWFENKKTGPWLNEIWRPGTKQELEDVISKNQIGKPFDTTAMIENFKKVLE